LYQSGTFERRGCSQVLMYTTILATSPGPQSVTVMSPALPVRLTCQPCARRKVKCDKKSPCTNCLKHKILCVAVERPRCPRGRSGKRATSHHEQLRDRIAKLEQKIQDFLPSSGEGSAEMISDGCGTITLQTGGSPNPFSETVQATRDLAGPKSVSRASSR
jgi:hypothetical protein